MTIGATQKEVLQVTAMGISGSRPHGPALMPSQDCDIIVSVLTASGVPVGRLASTAFTLTALVSGRGRIVAHQLDAIPSSEPMTGVYELRIGHANGFPSGGAIPCVVDVRTVDGAMGRALVQIVR